MGDLISLFLVVLFAVIAFYVINHAERKRQLVAVLQMYQHHNCPVLVTSNYPGDTTVHERAQTWRTMLRETGNKWYLAGKIAVVEFPYNAAFSGGSLYGYTWAEYVLQAAQEQHRLIMAFQQENAGVDPLIVTNYRAGV